MSFLQDIRATFLLGVTTGLYGTTRMNSVFGVLSAAIRGSGFGLLGTGYMMLVVAGPVGVGVIGDSGRFDLVFPRRRRPGTHHMRLG